MCGCARHGMRRGRCKGQCRITHSKSSPAASVRNITRLRDADPCLLSRDFRFGAHYGFNPDIAPCLKSANERTRFAGARCARSGASGTDGVTK